MKTTIELRILGQIFLTASTIGNPEALIDLAGGLMGEHSGMYDLKIEVEPEEAILYTGLKLQVGNYGFEEEWAVLEDEEWIWEYNTKAKALNYVKQTIAYELKRIKEQMSW